MTRKNGLLAPSTDLSLETYSSDLPIELDEVQLLNLDGGPIEDRELDLARVESEGLELLLDDDGERLVEEGNVMTRAVDGLVSLEAYVGGIKSPIHPAATSCVRIALEELQHTLNIENQTSDILSLEGFDRLATAAPQWARAHESIGSSLSLASGRMMEWVERFFAWLIDQMANIFNRSEKYAKIARDLNKASKAISYKGAPSEGGIVNAELVRFFSRGAKVLSPDEIFNRYQRYTVENKDSLGVTSTHAALKLLEAQQDERSANGTMSWIIKDLQRQLFPRYHRQTMQDDPRLEHWERELPFGSRFFELTIQKGVDGEPYGLSVGMQGRDQVEAGIQQRLMVMSIPKVQQLLTSVEVSMVSGFYREHRAVFANLRKLEGKIKKQATTEGLRARHLQMTKGLVVALMDYMRLASNYELTTTRRLLEYSAATLKAHRA